MAKLGLNLIELQAEQRERAAKNENLSLMEIVAKKLGIPLQPLRGID